MSSLTAKLVRRLQMPPGDHDISELPLRPGENVLKLEITDDTGQHSTLEFRVFFDHTLLAPGISEWGAAGGVVSTAELSGLSYNWSHPAATAYYRSGLTESFTGTAHVQARQPRRHGGRDGHHPDLFRARFRRGGR